MSEPIEVPLIDLLVGLTTLIETLIRRVDLELAELRDDLVSMDLKLSHAVDSYSRKAS